MNTQATSPRKGVPNVWKFPHATHVVATLALLPLIGSAVPSWAQGEVTTRLIPSGATRQLGGYMPQRLALTAEKPATVQRLPEGLTTPQYGVITFGPKEKPSSIVLVLDEPESGAPRLFVDSNANGDLTDDAVAEWKPFPYKSRSGMDLNRYAGTVSVPLPDGKSSKPVSFSLYRFDKKDEDRAALKNVVLYYRDYAVEGNLKLGSKTYRVVLDDMKASGDFRTSEAVRLLIDVNGNGRFDARGESYALNAPFNIGGTTYEVSEVSASGGRLVVGKSAKSVAEILPPPDLSPGKKALTFTAKTTGGETIRFPETYKGKLVLLDFWATWCGPCIAELPHLLEAYSTYHAQGFEVLGISLDQENAAEKLASFTKEKNMTWPQIYDGKYWQAEIAQLYVVQGIPAAYLVDGDTGEIVASGNSLRGAALGKTLAEALARKAKKIGVSGSSVAPAVASNKK